MLAQRVCLVPAAGALAAALLLTACGSAAPTGASSTPTGGSQPAAAGSSTASSSAVATTAQISTAALATLGQVLVDGRGMTLYVYTKDAPGQGISNCTGSCAQLWPPLLTAGTPTASTGVSGALGAIGRGGGVRQATIDGRPLYTYSGDAKPGQANGQGVGGTWYAVGPTGAPVTAGTTAGATVNVASNARLGPILVTAGGATLYLHTQDAPGVSTCTGNCAKLWPPLPPPSQGAPTAGPGVTGKLGVITRSGGGQQVTINGQPLYTYSGDAKAGQTQGQGVGNVWFAVKPSGAEA